MAKIMAPPDRAQLAELKSQYGPRAGRDYVSLPQLKLAGSNLLRAVPASCDDARTALNKARIEVVAAGENPLSGPRIIAACLSGDADQDRGEQQRASRHAGPESVERWAQALALLLKVYLVAEEKRLGENAFRDRYNAGRTRRGDGYTPISKPAVFLRNLAEPDQHVTPDPKLLAILGGFVGADLLLMRVRKDRELNNGANTSLPYELIKADPAVLQLAAPYRRQALAVGPRPVIPLLAVTPAGECVYRGLVPQPKALERPGSQVTNWRPPEDIRIPLPESAGCLPVPLYRLLDVYFEAGRRYWTVVRSGERDLVLQCSRRRRGGPPEPDQYFNERVVAVIERGSGGGKVVRLLQGEVEEALQQPRAPPGARHTQQLQAGPPPQAAAAAAADRVAQIAGSVLRCEDIAFLAAPEEGRAASHRSAKDSAADLLKSAAQVQSLAASPSTLHLVVVAPPGSGKTTLINKAIAELMATPEQLRPLLPPHLRGLLRPEELPGKGMTVAGLLALCSGSGAGPSSAAAGGAAAPVRRFSVSFKPLGPPAEAVEDCYTQGNAHDYFDLEARGVAEEVAQRLRGNWDNQPHLRQVGNKYNLCHPAARGQVYGCFMPNGRGVHCTDRTQHVHMRPPTRLEEAAFRFTLALPSRAELNKQIHQVRRYVAGEVPHSALDPLALVLVPLMCGLRAPDTVKEFERLLGLAALTDEEAAFAYAGEEGGGEDAASGRLAATLAERAEARAQLLSRLYPLQRYAPWLGHSVEFSLLTDDCVGASRWAEFWSTRFVLGRENAAFTLSGRSVMHIPSARLPVHVVDLPGVAADRDAANALQAAEVDAALRELSEQAGLGSTGNHTVLVLPSTGRGGSRQEVIRKLREQQVLTAALEKPEAFTLSPVINLCPGSLCVYGGMEEAEDGAGFAESYAEDEFNREYEDAFREALEETADELGEHKCGARRRLNAALARGQLLQGFALDTQMQSMAAARSTAVAGMCRALGGLAFEGLGLAVRLQGPSRAHRLGGRGEGGSGNEGGEEEEEEGKEANGPPASDVNVRKVTKALSEALSLQEGLEAGTSDWAAEVLKLRGPIAGPGPGSATEASGSRPPARVPAAARGAAANAVAAGAAAAGAPPPLTLQGVRAWVEQGSQLSGLLSACTPDKAEAALEAGSAWAEAYKGRYNRLLGNHLTSSDLATTNLPDLLLSNFKERGEGLVAAMLQAMVAGVVEADCALLRARLRGVRGAMQGANAALGSDPEVQLLMDVFDESIEEVLEREKQHVLRRLRRLTLEPEGVGGTASLPARWRDVLNSAAAREAARDVHKATANTARARRLLRVRTQLLADWKAALMPPAAPQPQQAQQRQQQQANARPAEGSVARIVYDLAQHLLQLYRRKRAGVIREAVAAARASTVSRLGPMALHVVRGGLEAARIGAEAAKSAPEPFCKELQAALRAARDAKRARMQALLTQYRRTDPLELLQAAQADGRLRAWVEDMAPGGGRGGGGGGGGGAGGGAGAGAGAGAGGAGAGTGTGTGGGEGTGAGTGTGGGEGTGAGGAGGTAAGAGARRGARGGTGAEVATAGGSGRARKRRRDT
ncbi:hypothetical protein HYH03_007700 [Edaphochlamys debaryana]|uniref:Uncharacterized protein n=1 Tax=Edaphochlamys debaryana TaxID=47281 RepID=A0A835Y192_9CHLO|nr:hypothetical protein HYH03_007700 [Edaphochlamys debaryana]|eukprot:KAG2494056.1 hypothetical protein HYH03_007700 [Edaphochlamys debaryana]